jgi:hypothetical protein
MKLLPKNYIIVAAWLSLLWIGLSFLPDVSEEWWLNKAREAYPEAHFRKYSDLLHVQHEALVNNEALQAEYAASPVRKFTDLRTALTSPGFLGILILSYIFPTVSWEHAVVVINLALIWLLTFSVWQVHRCLRRGETAIGV